ncbi:undecaprenyl-phosphate glucose phosphotransferase [Rhodocaloribacter litoris]|uniref:undecaprenyl-phosphate glucose phosphotransferase n=1 Tax=Rhodocaloribacter litoris TaxID=2558931 RepID=UPI00141FC410|nr:undecaprenyl-phosphate glucose phosphotransferase [Rhodocaloribacter litoris]QXD14238.1 undecaprenyl-phosphate glucose phosphotransferase [Rhodocaloribacter litoris]GIV59887.1 MAG: undecaprenyl-phosphate glucose phosphotransferase [Rhodothermaceae bacterium]
MLQEQSRLFQRLLFFADFVLVAVGWIAAFFIRFDLLRVLGVLPPPEVPPFSRYLGFLPWVLLVSSFVFWASGLYAPDRAQRLTRLIYSVAKAVGLGLLVLAATLSFYRDLYFSRLHMILFGMITPSLMVALRIALYAALRRARQRGKYRRRVLIVGAGKVGRRLEQAFRQYPWMGFEVVGFLDDHKTGPDILGTTGEAAALVDRYEAAGTPIHYVYLALPLTAAARIEHLTNALSTRLAHVCLVPDLFQFNILNSRVTDVDGLPVIHLIDEAPMEFRRFLKRVVDVVFSATVLVLAAPLMLVIAVAVKLSSPGPVFYRQERMGLNGHTFQMLKFRSMPVDAEAKTGAVWARPGEDRATPVGKFLRRTSLDELPQFINVLKGDMSVVGPRPERPVFIEQFRERVPGYMLRHKVKAGITGWAQVNGWRGDTSLEKRIEYDLYYIQHWSLKFDFKIMLMTLWKGFVNENAY